MGVPNFLGCQISCDTGSGYATVQNYTVKESQEPEVEAKACIVLAYSIANLKLNYRVACHFERFWLHKGTYLCSLFTSRSDINLTQFPRHLIHHAASSGSAHIGYCDSMKYLVNSFCSCY